MDAKFKIGDKVRIVSNALQPKHIGKIGEVVKVYTTAECKDCYKIKVGGSILKGVALNDDIEMYNNIKKQIMKMYQGTKVVQAEPMTMEEAFNQHLLQAGRTPRKGQDGYKVAYQDGYTSWSPKETFEKAYEPCDTDLEFMRIELRDVEKNIKDVGYTIISERFNELSYAQQAKLRLQLRAMNDHAGTLLMRIKDADASMDTPPSYLPFGMAIELLNLGYIVRRKGWNGKNIVVFKQVPATIHMDVVPNMQSLPDSAKELIAGTERVINYESQCLIYNYRNGRADSWTPSIADVFACDWELVEPGKIKVKYTQECNMQRERP